MIFGSSEVFESILHVALNKIMDTRTTYRALCIRNLPASELLRKMGEPLVQPGVLRRPTPHQHMLIEADHVLELVNEGRRQPRSRKCRRDIAARVQRIRYQAVEDLRLIRARICHRPGQEICPKEIA